MSTVTSYPTWIKVESGRWESEEQSGGTPDYIATHDRNGWRLKWRSSGQATVGFRTITEVQDYVARKEAEMDADAVERAAWIMAHRDEVQA